MVHYFQKHSWHAYHDPTIRVHSSWKYMDITPSLGIFVEICYLRHIYYNYLVRWICISRVTHKYLRLELNESLWRFTINQSIIIWINEDAIIFKSCHWKLPQILFYSNPQSLFEHLWNGFKLTTNFFALQTQINLIKVISYLIDRPNSHFQSLKNCGQLGNANI